MTGLHLAAYFGLREAMIVLLMNGHNPNAKVAKLLLEKDAKLESRDSVGLTPL
jgi:hypothetical protein